MNTSYDNELKKIEFYDRYHPEYLPYVGDNYDKTGVLLLGESNYVDADNLSADVIRLIKSPEWYTTDSRDEEKLPSEGCIDWCHNRAIINGTLDNKKKGLKTSPAHNMYINPAKAFIEVFPQVTNPWDAFTYFASMNYFQKPTPEKGQSFELTIEDNLFAADNLRRVVKDLKPETIIFLSKKSYWAFKANEPEELKELYIKASVHPNCAWWNDKKGNHGWEDFKNINRERVTCALL